MKKIIHFTHTDPRSDNRILKELFSLSKTKNYNISCVGISLNEGSANTNYIIDANILSINLNSNSICFLPKLLKQFVMFFELSYKFIRIGVKIKPSIVHCHDTLVLPIGLYFKIFHKSKLIYDAHELESNKNGQSKLFSIATLFIEKISWRQIDHFISVSNSIINWYNKNLGVKPNTLILNSPILNLNNLNNEKYFHRKYNIDDKILIFVYLGILGKGRGIEMMLDVFKNYKLNSHMVFVGYGELSEFIKNTANNSPNIHLHDSVPHEDVVKLVKNADVGMCLIENVSLSDYYCLPNKLFEYAFAGLKIISSNFPDIVSVVDKYHLGQTCELDTDSIYRAIIDIENSHSIQKPNDLHEISWQNQSFKLVQLYDKI